MNYTKSSYLAMISLDKKERKHFSERDHTNLEENHGKRNQYKVFTFGRRGRLL